MDIVSITNQIAKIAKIKKIDNSEYEVFTDAKINNSTPVKIFLRIIDGTVAFVDKKHTLKFMNTMYELKSPDVKGCIASVVKIYGFSIISGELIANIANEKNTLQTLFNYIMCVGQLANMYAFFDKP